MLRLFALFLQTPSGRLLRALLSLTLVGLFVGLVDWAALAKMPAALHWKLAALGVVCAAAAYPLHGLRWHLLLAAQGVAVTHGWTQAVTWIGGFYNSLLVGGVGGDAARAVYALRAFPKQKAAGVASLLMDRTLGLTTLLTLGTGFLLFALPARQSTPDLLSLGLAAAAGATGLVVASVIALRWSPHRWPEFVRAKMRPENLAIAESLRQRTLQQRGRHVAALVCSMAIWLVDFLSIWLLAASVGLKLPFLASSVAASAAYLATTLPISIGGHGVREGTLLATLAVFGLVSTAESEPALLLATAVWASTMLCSLIGGAVLLLWSDPRARP